MEMSEWVGMWKAIAENKPVRIPYDLFSNNQFADMIRRVFGSEQATYEYFQTVMDAEAPDYVKFGTE